MIANLFSSPQPPSHRRRPTSFGRWGLGLLGCLWAVGLTLGQEAAVGTVGSIDQEVPPAIVQLPVVEVTATAPLVADLLGGAGLTEVGDDQISRGGTLGDALAGVNGVGVASFGPAVGRPVLRGLGEARVAVLAGGLSVADASAVGPDHAVALDPLLIRRALVVRGPASLFYGNRALGGAVDVVTRTLPELSATPTAEGEAMVEYGSASRRRTALAAQTVSRPGWAVGLAAVARRGQDVSIPGLARRTDVTVGHSHGNAATPEPNPDGTLPNTWLAADTVTLGARFGGAASVALGYTFQESAYGVPFHSHADHTGQPTVAVADVRLELRQERLEAEARWQPGAGSHLWQVRAAYTDYGHREIEGGAAATTFAVRTAEARAEATGELGQLTWGIGLQGLGEQFRSSTRNNPFGAYFPGADTTQAAVFGLARWQAGPWQAAVGARAEHTRLSLVDFAGYDATYSPPSASASLGLRFTEHGRLDFSLSRSERAPTTAELFANGGHLATGLFTRGSIFQFPSVFFDTERGWLAEASTQWQFGRTLVQVTAHGADFDRFLFLRRTEFTDDSTGLPIFDYVERPARLWGAEVEVRHRWALFGGTLDGRLTGELTRGEQTGPDGVARPLPRMPPTRVRGYLGWERGRFGIGLEVTRLAQQDRVELNSESFTPGYTDVGLTLRQSWQMDRTEVELTLQATNLLDETQRNHLSYLKDVAPLAGRGFALALRGQW